MNITTEQTFETAIVQHLTSPAGGWLLGEANAFDRATALFPEVVIDFLRVTQPKAWEQLVRTHGAAVREKVLARLSKELELRGTLDVLRNGIVDYGVRLRLCYFRPETGLNPATQALYDENLLHVTRQVRYSLLHENSLDLVLSVNGLPVATAELKNRFTGQQVAHARRQYATNRDPRELLFRGKSRALVHFALDDEQVFMTTELAGEATHYLPFNRGYYHGAGNPPVAAGYRTAYLWEEVWQRDSWLDIVGRFLHVQTESGTDRATGRPWKRDRVVFPRYHQLDAVRRLSTHARQHGAGHHYLIQHSAGSGKSNSIAWLAYRISSLHDAQDRRVFDSVIVVTDRRVLDQQLQNTIYQFEHKTGVVQKIDQHSQQLAEALGAGTAIIITTLQKFPFVVEKVGRLPDRRYAVIVDEAHSSQGGEASKKLKEVLAATSLEEAEALEVEAAAQDEDGEDFVRRSLLARGRQPNLSFFAFTATPKPKTLAVFGEPGPDGRPRPFHLYSMRQAIEEGFIMDVLRNYTTYELYFKLSKAIADDPELNRKKAAVAIGRFVSLHPHNLAQKTEIIIEHFRQVVAHKIGGRAKAMVVTSSRLHALRYYLAFREYIQRKGYQDIRALVAFSGKVVAPEFPDGVTEPQLNGFGEKALPEQFGGDEYRLLLVANKYQTGFDQPLLHTMYVDKKLNGVLAVQTLSRLNRMCAGKDDSFVLDFANDRQTILDAFQPYYELTTMADATDPNLLYDLKHRLDARQVWWPSEIDGFARVFFRDKLSARDQARLYAFVDPAADRFRALPEEEQDEFRRQLSQWLRLYAFLSQIIPFQDAALEKLFAYGKYLLLKLPERDLAEQLRLHDEVALHYYRLQKTAEGHLALEQQGEYGLQGPAETGMKREKEEKAPLSQIIHVLNERFGTEFTEADRLFFDQIQQALLEDEKLASQARINSVDDFRFGFDEAYDNTVIDRMLQNQDIVHRLLNDAEFGGLVRRWMLRSVYEKLRAESG